MGEVEAVEMVTVGQRKGLGLPGGGPKRYVVDVDVANQVVTVGDDADLLRPGSTCSHRPGSPSRCRETCGCSAARTARRSSPTCRSTTIGIRVDWHEPQRRIAPGQSVVFYDETDRRVLGGGICA